LRRQRKRDSTSVSPPSANSQNLEELRKRKRVEEDEEFLGTSKIADVPPPKIAATTAGPAAATLWDLAQSVS
jgi:hypothetical protein